MRSRSLFPPSATRPTTRSPRRLEWRLEARIRPPRVAVVVVVVVAVVAPGRDRDALASVVVVIAIDRPRASTSSSRVRECAVASRVCARGRWTGTPGRRGAGADGADGARDAGRDARGDAR